MKHPLTSEDVEALIDGGETFTVEFKGSAGSPPAGPLSWLLQLGEDTTRGLLNRMVDRGILQARGEARGRTYHLSAGAYRALGEGVAYVRARGFEPLQQEQMVLSYVAAHGRITRSEAAELCQIAPLQAGRLLRHLVDQGKLILRGTRRWAHYERAR